VWGTFNIIVPTCHYTRTVYAKIRTTTIYVPYASSWMSTKRTIGPIVRVAFDCGSLPINERGFCAPCLQAVHSISSHQHDRFAIFFIYTYIYYFFSTDYYYCLNVFFRLPNSGFGYNNCMFDRLLTSKYDLRQLFGGARK
jgi:hypothetical protein